MKANTECELILTFRYGDDEPYDLVFVPLDNLFLPVRATWRPTLEEIVTDAPSPVYPKTLSWNDLRKMPKPDSYETSDLLEWVLEAIDRLDRDLVVRPQRRIIGTLARDWGIDSKGYHISRARSEISKDVFIHERNFVEGFTYSSFQRGSQVSFELQESRDGKFSGRRVASFDYKETGGIRKLDEMQVGEIVKYIHNGIYFPMIKIWSDGRSIEDSECPEEFVNAISERLDLLAELINEKQLPNRVRSELHFLLACTHQDTRKECVEWIVEQIGTNSLVDPQAIGFAIGDLTKPWQRYLFSLLTKESLYYTTSVCAFAIWRAPRFLEQLKLEEISLILGCVLDRLARLQPQQGDDGVFRLSVLPLELLLGLLRTRTSDDPEIKMLLQPHQKITKQLVEQVDRIEEIVAESNIALFSRVQLDVQKPEGIRTPDLLYALHLYLTGDDGANAIHITGVSDTDD